MTQRKLMTIFTLVLIVFNFIWKPHFSESFIEKIVFPLGLHQSVDTQGQWWAFHACAHSQLVSRAKQLSAFLWLDTPQVSDLLRGSGDNGSVSGTTESPSSQREIFKTAKECQSANSGSASLHQSASLSASHTGPADCIKTWIF